MKRLFLAVLALCCMGTHQCYRRPNIILIETDDQRWDTVSYMPHVLSDLAAHGVTFSNSFTTTPLCAPSRASMLTGRYAHNTGVLRNGPPSGGYAAFDPTTTIATRLHDAGYATGLFGKYMNGYLTTTVPPGWDTWHGVLEQAPYDYYNYTINEDGTLVSYGSSPADYMTDVLNGQLLDFITAHAGGPFFAVFTPIAPHGPGTPAPRDVGSLNGLPPWRPASYDEADMTDKPLWWQYLAGTMPPPQDTLRQSELESLGAVDDAVGAIVATLTTLGINDDTLIVFTSDNGFQWNEHWWWGKEAGYDESIRVPLIIRYPHGFTGVPRTDARIALNIDLAPTFAEFGQASPLPDANGVSLVCPLHKNCTPSPAWRTDTLTEGWGTTYLMPPTFAGVWSPPYNYIATNDPGVGLIEEELYNTTTDPAEMSSLSSNPSYTATLAALRARLATLVSD